MRSQKNYSSLTLLISILLGILLPLNLRVKDPTLISITFSLVWAIYSLTLLEYVFLVEGRRNRNKLMTSGGYKDLGMGNPTGIEIGNRTRQDSD